jgi:glycosyltransferase involved in cell wall biosynthesis
MSASALKILMLCYEFPPIGGGGAKVANGLINELRRRGHAVDLVTMGYQGLPSFEQHGELRIHRVPCWRRKVSVCTPLEMALYMVTAFLTAWRLCRQNQYDLNHTHFIFPDGVVAYLIKKWWGIPFIITAHGSDVPGYNPDRFRLLHKLLTPFWKKIVKAAETLVFPSSVLRNLALGLTADFSSIVIPNGFDPNRFSPAKAKKNRILLVTRMFQRKGVQHFLRAAKDLDREIEINIVGDGPYLNALKAMAADLAVNAKFWGHLDNYSRTFRELYETSAVFVFTSEAENFPTVLLEAMAAGSAIITTSGTGCAEVVGKTAMLVNPANTAELRQALHDLARQPEVCEQMGKEARYRLEANFTWPAIAERYLALYAKVPSPLEQPEGRAWLSWFASQDKKVR